MEYPHLSHAPIVEGLIDILVKPRSDLTLDDLVCLSEKLKSKYPEVKALHTIQTDVQIDQSQRALQSVATALVGYRLERKDLPFVLMLRVNGLTISRLRPYEDWNNLLGEAKPIWDEYVSICRPEAITRVATRYINRIELPIEGLDFDDYLAAPPRIPKDLNGMLSEFLVRLVVPDVPSGASIALVQALEGPNMQKSTIPVIIDIDVFKAVELDLSSNELWKLLGTLRDLKNRTFFGSITPKTLELLK